MNPNNPVFIFDRRSALKTYSALIGAFFWGIKSASADDKIINGPRSALIIGNSKYPDSPLSNPANDATAISKELNLLGFNTSLLMDANLKNLATAIQKYTDLLNKEKSIGLFYYAGHGVQLGWRNYLVPVDAAIDKVDDIPKQTYELNVLLTELNKAKNLMNIIILDACRDNPFGKKLPIEQRGLSQFDAPPNSVLCYATAPGNVASDGTNVNGLFTENLLREMRNPSAKIEDVMKRVRLNVRLASNGQQIPWESTSLEQDFYFNAKGVDPQFIEKEVNGVLANLKVTSHQNINAGHLTPTESSPIVAPTKMIEAPSILTAPTIAVEDVNKKVTEAEKDRRFKEELALWEKAAVDPSPKLVEEYIRKYPNGDFSQLAQVRLDQLLAKGGEKKVQVISSVNNPFSKGSASVVDSYTLGDSYSFEVKDLLTKVIQNSFTDVVSEISDDKIIFNQGERIIDLLGNELKSRNIRFLSPAQFYPEIFEVGKKWTTRFKWLMDNGQPTDIVTDFIIKKRFEYQSKLGVFNAFEVEGWGYTTQGGRLLMKYLVDPDKCAQPLVFDRIMRGFNGQVLGAANRELVAFSQQKVRMN
ncbi:caspase family protein [Polynucleobacter kasalickyi]|uniref:Caspase domain-containing protein n=1 Tax=Polynucleobacter kasalickyi TaxID=1938817 RepID=A0A1W1Y9E6_9BURK|nr:caspase family protein [Polynucleobacter kasalickyi]SMC32782.1 Caspase domain-containing protein [Polynucleobacter kasalickyi]